MVMQEVALVRMPLLLCAINYEGSSCSNKTLSRTIQGSALTVGTVVSQQMTILDNHSAGVRPSFKAGHKTTPWLHTARQGIEPMALLSLDLPPCMVRLAEVFQ